MRYFNKAHKKWEYRTAIMEGRETSKTICAFLIGRGHKETPKSVAQYIRQNMNGELNIEMVGKYNRYKLE